MKRGGYRTAAEPGKMRVANVPDVHTIIVVPCYNEAHRLRKDTFQRTRARRKGKVVVHVHLLQPPAAGQIQTAARFEGEGRNRHAILKGDSAAADALEAERRTELGDGGRAGACREEQADYDVGKNQAGAPAKRTQRSELCRRGT